MGFLKFIKELKYMCFPKYEPLPCKPIDVIDLMREVLEYDEGGVRFIINYNDVRHFVGVMSDYAWEKGFFDYVCYLDSQEFKTLEEFCAYAMIDGTHFTELSQIIILEDEDAGDPLSNKLLFDRYGVKD